MNRQKGAASRTISRTVTLTVGMAWLALAGSLPGGAAAQEVTGWVAIQIYACPGMDAETLDPWACELVKEGVDVQLETLAGAPLLGLGDAYFDGWTWTWSWLPVGPPGEAYPYQVVPTAPPPGTWGNVVLYAPAGGDGSVVWLSSDAPGADLHVYNFVS